DGSAAEQSALFRPGVRQFRKARQLLRCQLPRLGTIQNTIDKVRREKGELQGSAEVGSVDPVGSGNVADAAARSVRQLLDIGVGSGEELDQAIVRRLRDRILAFQDQFCLNASAAQREGTFDLDHSVAVAGLSSIKLPSDQLFGEMRNIQMQGKFRRGKVDTLDQLAQYRPPIRRR